jgi:hypothetical protein
MRIVENAAAPSEQHRLTANSFAQQQRSNIAPSTHASPHARSTSSDHPTPAVPMDLDVMFARRQGSYRCGRPAHIQHLCRSQTTLPTWAPRGSRGGRGHGGERLGRLQLFLVELNDDGSFCVVGPTPTPLTIASAVAPVSTIGTTNSATISMNTTSLGSSSGTSGRVLGEVGADGRFVPIGFLGGS